MSIAILEGTFAEASAAELFVQTFPALALIRLGVFWRHDLYQGLWRYVSFQDLLNIIRATVISTVAFVILGVFWSAFRVPERLAILDLALCIVLTGGGGSIGSELCRQIAAFHPKGLVLVERAENSLYDFERELREMYPLCFRCMPPFPASTTGREWSGSCRTTAWTLCSTLRRTSTCR